MKRDADESPKVWPPLGLPSGSVRALLTLLVVAVVVSNIARGRTVDILWTETLLIALAHYFTARRFVELPPDVREDLENQGVIERESNPLYLPRHSIRFLILLAFGGLGYYLYQENRWREPQAFGLLTMVAAYLLGTIVRGVTHWLHRRRAAPPSRFWGDARAVIVLVALTLIAVPELMNLESTLPPDFEKAALGLVLFYFGSR